MCDGACLRGLDRTHKLMHAGPLISTLLHSPSSNSYCIHKKDQNVKFFSRNLKDARTEYYTNFLDAFQHNILAEQCAFATCLSLSLVWLPYMLSCVHCACVCVLWGLLLLLLLTLPLSGVLDGEVVAVNKLTGEHESFGHNKTVAISKVRSHTHYIPTPTHKSISTAHPSLPTPLSILIPLQKQTRPLTTPSAAPRPSPRRSPPPPASAAASTAGRAAPQRLPLLPLVAWGTGR